MNLFNTEPPQDYITSRLKFLRIMSDANGGLLLPLEEAYLNQEGKCAYCNQRTWLEKVNQDGSFLATKDHFIPRSKGGKDGQGNVLCSCHRCNQQKGDQYFPTFMPRTPYAGGGE
jgi:5-methylcytosine-specific restriction endonuclease McrA